VINYYWSSRKGPPFQRFQNHPCIPTQAQLCSKSSKTSSKVKTMGLNNPRRRERHKNNHIQITNTTQRRNTATRRLRNIKHHQVHLQTSPVQSQCIRLRQALRQALRQDMLRLLTTRHPQVRHQRSTRSRRRPATKRQYSIIGR
jgi:hypothetical protein